MGNTDASFNAGLMHKEGRGLYTRIVYFCLLVGSESFAAVEFRLCGLKSDFDNNLISAARAKALLEYY